MKGFLYTITLQEPVLANSLGGEPNSARSLFYVPGGLVRGAVINSYPDKDANDDSFRSLFLTGETRFLNAYPLVNGERSLPIPLKYKRPKYLDAGSFGNLDGDGKKIYALEEEWQVNIHTQRDPQKGRATENSGAVYRYIALPAGMKFRGAVVSSISVKPIQDALDNKTILLGKARTAGYGSAKITVQNLPADWREIRNVVPSDLNEFTILLLSPALVRNSDGQFTLDISTALSARLNGKKVNIVDAFSKSEIVGGFNRTWGLPLPQATAIAAGSIFHVTLDSAISAKEAEVLEATGIGERRAEGFGSLVMITSLPDIEAKEENWNKLKLPDHKEEADSEKVDLSPEENQLLEMMITRLLRRDLDQQIVTQAREMTQGYKRDSVPNSQLSRWRVILRDALAKENPTQRLKAFYQAENKKRSPAFVKMEKAKLKTMAGPKRLTEWAEELLEHPEDRNQISESAFKLAQSIDTEPIKLSDELITEYNLRLLDAVLAMMGKMNSVKGGNHG